MFKLINLYFKNINNYGFLNSVKILIFEIIGLLKVFNIEEFKFSESLKTSYSKSKTSNFYNTAYIPTPYYFLYLINNELNYNRINKFNFIDLGCGYSRPANYLLSKGKNINYLGIDIDVFKNVDSKKYKILNLDLRKFNKVNKILGSFIKKGHKNVIFLSDPFDKKLVFKILNYLNTKKKKIICILINVNVKNMNKSFKLIYSKKFNKRNIEIFRN